MYTPHKKWKFYEKQLKLHLHDGIYDFDEYVWAMTISKIAHLKGLSLQYLLNKYPTKEYLECQQYRLENKKEYESTMTDKSENFDSIPCCGNHHMLFDPNFNPFKINYEFMVENDNVFNAESSITMDLFLEGLLK
jgi:galactose mutarotase-like enzyme